MEEGCTCIAVKEQELSERTGYVKLYEFPVGEDEDGNPCPLHDPRKKTMSTETQDQLQEARQDRGEQLRALVVSWDESKTFLLALNQQQRSIEDGEFAVNEDWAVMADEILGAYMSRPKMNWPEGEEEPKDDGPKLILPA